MLLENILDLVTRGGRITIVDDMGNIIIKDKPLEKIKISEVSGHLLKKVFRIEALKGTLLIAIETF